MNTREATAPDAAVGMALEHESADLHVSGQAIYTDDIAEAEGTLHAAIGLSSVAHGTIDEMDLSGVASYPGVVGVFTARDIPGSNAFGIVAHDEPILADKTVSYWGQPVFVVVATSTDSARRAALRARITYGALEAVLDPFEAKARAAFVAPTRTIRHGRAQPALATAPVRCEGNIRIGGQEHFYLEGQVAYAIPAEDRKMLIHSATQHPTEMQQVVAKLLGWPAARVTVLCRRMGGAFGGKESQSYIFTGLAALAAHLTRCPVKLRADRDDDFLITGKRHEFWVSYRLGAQANGVLDAVELEHVVRCGHSSDYSAAVCDRAVFHANNAYYTPNMDCTSYRARTNTQSATAFRGFGGPQGVLGIEVAMEALALQLRMDPLDVRERNLYGDGERAETHYGFRLQDNVMPALVAQLARSSRYRERRAQIRDFNAKEPCIKRGIALMPVLFGVGFGATFLNQAGALVQVYADGSVILNHGGTEMGQGLHTKLLQVVAQEFGVAYERVVSSATDTSKVPNTASTAGSTGTDINGMAVLDAVRKIRARMAAVAARHLGCAPDALVFARDMVRSAAGASMTFSSLCALAFHEQVSLSATGYYRTPKVGYDLDAFRGRPFFYYVYGAACSEVMIDTLTGESKVVRVDILQDVGRSINPALDRGQIEGGFIQGMGWMTSEELVWREDGFLATHAPQTYKIPTSRDIPAEFHVDFFENENAEETIHRSKAVGEPPLKLALSVYLAIWDAVASAGGRKKMPTLNVPATPEAILRALASVQDVGPCA